MVVQVQMKEDWCANNNVEEEITAQVVNDVRMPNEIGIVDVVRDEANHLIRRHTYLKATRAYYLMLKCEQRFYFRIFCFFCLSDFLTFYFKIKISCSIGLWVNIDVNLFG